MYNPLYVNHVGGAIFSVTCPVWPAGVTGNVNVSVAVQEVQVTLEPVSGLAVPVNIGEKEPVFSGGADSNIVILTQANPSNVVHAGGIISDYGYYAGKQLMVVAYKNLNTGQQFGGALLIVP